MPGRHGALILALLVLIHRPASSEELRVTGWRANLRAGASRSSAVVATLDRGVTLELLGRKGSWYRVRVPSAGVDGYVHASMVERGASAAGTPAAPAPAPSVPEAAPPRAQELRVTAWKANVRTSASRSSAVVATLDRGATLELLGRKGSWHWVRIPSSRDAGYVHASMVEVVPRVASAPVPQAPPVPRPRAMEPAPRPALPPPESTPPMVPAEPPASAYRPPPPPSAAAVEVVEEEPELRFRAFGQGAFIAFNARDSFNAIFGSSTGATFGGGLEVKYREFFAQVALNRFRKTGERVFVVDGEVFPLGIDDTVTITPLSVFVGYRFRRIGPATLYAGLGIGSYKLQETFAFADAEETVDDRFTGYQGRVGAEFRVHKWVNLAAEIEYATVPSSLGTGGVSQIFADENLGGASFRIRVLVGP